MPGNPQLNQPPYIGLGRALELSETIEMNRFLSNHDRGIVKRLSIALL